MCPFAHSFIGAGMLVGYKKGSSPDAGRLLAALAHGLAAPPRQLRRTTEPARPEHQGQCTVLKLSRLQARGWYRG